MDSYTFSELPRKAIVQHYCKVFTYLRQYARKVGNIEGHAFLLRYRQPGFFMIDFFIVYKPDKFWRSWRIVDFSAATPFQDFIVTHFYVYP